MSKEALKQSKWKMCAWKLTNLTFDSDREICQFFQGKIVPMKENRVLHASDPDDIPRWQVEEFAKAAQDHLGNHLLEQILDKVAKFQVDNSRKPGSSPWYEP